MYPQRLLSIPGWSRRSHSRCGTGDRMTGCLRRSPATIADLVAAVLPSVLWCPLHACIHCAYEPLTLLRGRCGTASSSLRPSPHASARYEGDDTQSAAVQRTTPSVDLAVHYQQALRHAPVDARIDPSQGAGSFLIISLHFHGPGRSSASRSGLQQFFPSISLSVETSIICSASSFFSFA